MSTLTAKAQRVEVIARLNYRCRLGLDRTGRDVITRTCLATFSEEQLPTRIVAQAEILAAIRKDRFPEEASPRGRGHVEYRGTKVYFAIDAYDLDLVYGSEDPADASVSRRVMTIMVREDVTSKFAYSRNELTPLSLIC